MLQTWTGVLRDLYVLPAAVSPHSLGESRCPKGLGLPVDVHAVCGQPSDPEAGLDIWGVIAT